MGTRLLSPKEVRERKATVLDAEVREATKIHNFVASETQKLNEWKEHERKERERVEKEAEETRKDLNSTISTLRTEVSSLEDRKKEALKPLTERSKALDEREKELAEYKKAQDEAKEALDAQKSSLVEAISSLQDARWELEARQEAVKRQEQASEAQAAYVSSSHKVLNDRIQTFNALVESKTSEQAEKDRLLALREAEIDADKRWIVSQRDALAREARVNASERAAIQSAYDQLKKKL